MPALSAIQNVLIIGATSAIAEAVMRQLAKAGAHRFVLAARDRQKLEILAQDLRIQCHGEVHIQEYHAEHLQEAEALIAFVQGLWTRLDVVLIAHGSLPDQRVCEVSVAQTMQALQINGLSVIALLTLLSPLFEAQKQGTMAVISSVAGDRGRQSNYVYGAGKGMVSLFMQGLRNRLSQHGVQVLTIKPGFVDTPMTSGWDKSSPLWATPDQIAAGIVRAIEEGRDVVYLPWFWRWILLVIVHIPERIFKKMGL